ncbi:MAG TPA: GDSL-type esterase/lipase family protein [Luteitalea sp.]|nr:GDSL-type esterase/lipase family protein [Luteitalea sp.]
MLPRSILLIVVVCASLTACGGSDSPSTAPPTQPTPIATPLSLTCPAPLSLRTTTGQPVPLGYAMPQATGGTEPVVVACVPASGATAPVGQTTVTCSATDGRQQTSTCSFGVTVTLAPTLRVERFLALGDSFTFGTVSRAPMREIPGANYVQKLEFLLRERYPDQAFTVTNAGVPGQFMDQIEDRYPATLRSSNAQVLLLEGGANDINTEGARAIRDVVTRIERVARDAQSRGVSVILATLTPQRPGSPKGTAPAEVRDLNNQIRDLCRRYQTGCADLYAAFGNEQSPLIGADGLHPTMAGYDLIAETYFTVIRQMFERIATP